MYESDGEFEKVVRFGTPLLSMICAMLWIFAYMTTSSNITTLRCVIGVLGMIIAVGYCYQLLAMDNKNATAGVIVWVFASVISFALAMWPDFL